MSVIPYSFILYFSYTIFSYDFHILCFSYIVLSYYLSYTFRVIDTLFLVLVYWSYTFLFHILYLFIYFSFAYTCHFLLGFMSANTLEADTGNNCMYPMVRSLYETVISICIYPKVSSLYETVTYAM